MPARIFRAAETARAAQLKDLYAKFQKMVDAGKLDRIDVYVDGRPHHWFAIDGRLDVLLASAERRVAAGLFLTSALADAVMGASCREILLRRRLFSQALRSRPGVSTKNARRKPTTAPTTVGSQTGT